MRRLVCSRRRPTTVFLFAHRQADALALDVDLEDANLDHVARLHHLMRVFDKAISELRDMDEAVLVNADIDERAKSSDIGHRPFEQHARLKVADVIDAFGEYRGLELRPWIAARLFKFGDESRT